MCLLANCFVAHVGRNCQLNLISIIKNHVSSSKHKQSKDVVAKRQAREVDIAEAIKEYDDTVHPVGETLPEVQKIFRVKVVTSFLKAGVPLSKLRGTFVKSLSNMPTSLPMTVACSTLQPLFWQKNAKELMAN